MSTEIGKPLKYPITISFKDAEFINDEHRNKFKDDFDDVGNVFLHELSKLTDKYGLTKFTVYKSEVHGICGTKNL